MTIGSKTTPTLDDMVREAHTRLGVGKARKKPGDPEHQLQAALIARIRTWDKVNKCWQRTPLSVRFPELMDIFAIPNGGVRDERTAGKLKAEGVLAGVSDLLLPVPARGNYDCEITSHRPSFHGLWLETKVPGNYPTASQREFMEHMVARGYAVAVWRTLEVGLMLLERYVTGRWEQTEDLLK